MRSTSRREGGSCVAMDAHDPVPLPKVQTRRQLVDYLEDQITAPADKGGEPSGRGRPRELKSYVVETNGSLALRGGTNGTTWEVDGTGVEGIKIFRVRREGWAAEFFADVGDRRFLTLHTSGEPREAKAAIDGITGLHPPAFDRMWLPHCMLDAVARDENNKFQGFGVRFAGGFASDAGDAALPLEDFDLTLNGSLARNIEEYLKGNGHLESAIAYRKVRVMRGDGADQSNYVHDDIYDEGYFAIRRGKSVRDHINLVRTSKDRYARAVEEIEKCRLGVRRTGGKWRFMGEPLNFEFRKKIPDVGQLVRALFDSTEPFRLWGLEAEVEKGYYSVAGVDLHTGDPLNFEVADDMMRVYLNKHSCGNTVLRLLCNLQARFGAGIRCRQVEEAVGD